MSVKRRRRRGSGSLADLKRYLWAVVCYNLDVVEDEERSHLLRQKASNALVQASMAYVRVTETADILPMLKQLEAAATGTGREPT